MDVRFDRILRGCFLTGRHQLLVDNHRGEPGASLGVSRARCLSLHPWDGSLALFHAFPTDGAAVSPKAEACGEQRFHGDSLLPVPSPTVSPCSWSGFCFPHNNMHRLYLVSVIIPTSPAAYGWQDPSCPHSSASGHGPALGEAAVPLCLLIWGFWPQWPWPCSW